MINPIKWLWVRLKPCKVISETEFEGFEFEEVEEGPVIVGNNCSVERGVFWDNDQAKAHKESDLIARSCKRARERNGA
jgi:hypothetical protein